MKAHLLTLALLSSGIQLAGAVTGAPGPKALSPVQIMQLKFQEVCARADENRDGYINRREFPDLQRPAPAFRMADANGDGRLDRRECERVLGTT